MAKKKISLWEFRGIVIKVTDGDTVHIEVDQGFGGSQKVIFRLARINAPELRITDSKGPLTNGGIAAKDNLTELCLNKRVYFYSTKYDPYGRSIADIYLSQDDITPGNCLSDLQVAQGHAVYVKY